VYALVELLRQLAGVLEGLTDEQYAQRPVGVVPGSIGGHVRHSLDHVRALAVAAGTGELDYDSRRRDTDIERRRSAALAELRQLECRLLEQDWPAPEGPLRLTALVSAEGPPAEVVTTLGRELAFVVSHTIHHDSLISVMLALLGARAPGRFGYAPSTIAHQEGRPCVR
jgi:uncharacterized damage-inducible protein DinB